MEVRYYSWQEFVYIHFQDPLTKNWWIGGDGYYMGYFPSKLFSNMGSADKVGLGGNTHHYTTTTFDIIQSF